MKTSTKTREQIHATLNKSDFNRQCRLNRYFIRKIARLLKRAREEQVCFRREVKQDDPRAALEAAQWMYKYMREVEDITETLTARARNMTSDISRVVEALPPPPLPPMPEFPEPEEGGAERWI